MKNNNLNNENLNVEIDFREILRTIFNSKKIIILITLASALLAFIYIAQKEPEYNSTVILELGSYPLINGENKIVEPVDSLIKKLKINQVHQRLNKLNYNSIEGQLLEINYISPSPEFNEKLINQAIIFSQESHMKILDKIVNSFSEKIVTTDYKIDFLKNSIANQIESRKLIAINSIKAIDNEILAHESKIKYLLELIPIEENNLLLIESSPANLLRRLSSSPTMQEVIYSYKEQTITLRLKIQNLQLQKETLETEVKSIEKGKFASEDLFKLKQDKDTLELQIKYIAKGEFVSGELFKLQQEKATLELQVKLLNDQTNITRPISELVTSKIEVNNPLIISIITILGFIFSVFIVFIRQVFLKEQN